MRSRADAISTSAGSSRSVMKKSRERRMGAPIVVRPGSRGGRIARSRAGRGGRRGLADEVLRVAQPPQGEQRDQEEPQRRDEEPVDAAPIRGRAADQAADD